MAIYLRRITAFFHKKYRSFLTINSLHKLFPDRLRDGCGLKISAGCWLGEKTAVKMPVLSFEVTGTWDAKVTITSSVTLGAKVTITSGTQSDSYF